MVENQTMKPSTSRPGDKATYDPWDFSLVLGGPLFQLLRRARLSDDALTLVRRRVLAISLFTWVPLLVLSALGGQLLGGGAAVPFLMDVDAHVKFLVVVPLLIAAELVVHQRMRPLVEQFLKQGLIPESARTGFDSAVASAMRLRNSVLAEVLLIAVVYGFGILVFWRHFMVLDTTTWYARPSAAGSTLSLPGMWYTYVSLPIFQFLLLRWLFRLIIWTRFLWQVSRLGLNLVLTHPDRAGGLGFLSGVLYAFVPLAAAAGALVAGGLANRIFYAGAKLPEFKMPIAAGVLLLVFFFVGPLLAFVPRLAQAKRTGLLEYGALAQRYVREFDAKWLRGGATADEPLVGSGDIQSLADLANSFDVVRTMRMAPVAMQDILRLAIATLVPIAPLLLTVMPLEELLKLVFGLLR
jgi:hypothetical protein